MCEKGLKKVAKMEVIFSDRFENELFAIADYISLYSERRADLFVEEVESRCYNLATMSYKCRKSLKFDSESVRDLIYKGYVIPYLIKDDCINILGIYKANAWDA